MYKRFIAIFLILCFLTVIFIPENTTAETIYLGGSRDVGGVDTGKSGNFPVVLAEEFPMALRISIQRQKPGDFAKQGYANSYPVSEYSLVLVPDGDFKPRTVLASKGYGKCDYVPNHPGVVTENTGDAKGAIWELFMGSYSGVYNGNAKALIGENGLTAKYNADLNDLFARILDGSNNPKIDSSYLNTAGGYMYVSIKDIPKEDKTKQAQMALTGLALGAALKELGYEGLELSDMANYFLGEVSKHEYIVIIENMLAFKDKGNESIGYWWTLPNTAISQISGHDIIPEEYSGTTGEYLENVCVNKIYASEGTNKIGYTAQSGNKAQQYLFNYWFSPTNANGDWVTDVAVSTLWYTREYREDENGEPIWGEQYKNTNPNNLYTGKFGFNVLTCFASNPVYPEGGDGVHQLYSKEETIYAERSQEVEAIQSADFKQYDAEIREDIVNKIYSQYIPNLEAFCDKIIQEHEDSMMPWLPWEETVALEFIGVDYNIEFSGDTGGPPGAGEVQGSNKHRYGPGEFEYGVEKDHYSRHEFGYRPASDDNEEGYSGGIPLKVQTVTISNEGIKTDISEGAVKERIRAAINELPSYWQVGYTRGTFDEPGTYIWEYYSEAWLDSHVIRKTEDDSGVEFEVVELEDVSLKTSYAKTLIIVPNISRQYLRWYNQPLGFAEVKQGTWSGDRSTEKWEAMAGVPTTETLYINAGGTPVFCDIKAKYTEASITKNYKETYTYIPEEEGQEPRTTTVVRDTTFDFSYITIESVTIRTAEKAILNNAKIFVEPRQEVGVFNKVVCEVDSDNIYYQDGRGADEETFAYGLSSEDYMWSDSGSDPNGANGALDEHLKKIKVFRNSDKVTIYIDGIEYEILVGAHDVGTVVPSDEYPEPATLTVDISEQWKPTEPNGTYIWDKYTKIPVVGYIGNPKAGEDRNVASGSYDTKLFLYKEGIEIPLNQVNGYYDFVDIAEEQYISFSEAFGLIKENLNSEPDDPVYLEYADYRSPESPYTLDQLDGKSVNPVVIHNPVSSQDCWIHSIDNDILQDQRIDRERFENPKTYIDFQFYLTIPNKGSFEVNETSTNKTDLDANSLLKVVDTPGELGKSFAGKYNLAFNTTPRGLNYPSDVPDAANLDTSLWIRAKYIKLPFNAYYKDKFYNKGTWITLYDQGRDRPQTGDEEHFKLYITSDNPDIEDAIIYCLSEAINAPADLAGNPDKLYAEAEKNANTLRDKNGVYKDLDGDIIKRLSARHSTSYTTIQDVIGRIGNVIVDESTDPRYANIFWKSDLTKPISRSIYWPLIEPGGKFYSLYFNIFEDANIGSPAFDNRWGTLNEYHDASLYRLGDIPVTTASNIIPGYASRAVRLGYPIQFSIQTLGSYGEGSIRITPHYLYVNPAKGLVYEDISLYVGNGADYNRYYDAPSSVDADTAQSFEPNQRITQAHSLKNARAKINEIEKATQSYIDSTNVNQTILGTPSYMEIPTKLRTYIGSTQTTGNIGDGDYDHTGNIANVDTSWKNAQRWHASLYLPSSTIVMGRESKKFYDKEGFFLITYMKFETANSSAPWNLELKTAHENDGEGNPTKPDTTVSSGINAYGPGTIVTYPTPPSDYPKPEIPIVVFDVQRTSATDADIVGTH